MWASLCVRAELFTFGGAACEGLSARNAHQIHRQQTTCLAACRMAAAQQARRLLKSSRRRCRRRCRCFCCERASCSRRHFSFQSIRINMFASAATNKQQQQQHSPISRRSERCLLCRCSDCNLLHWLHKSVGFVLVHSRPVHPTTWHPLRANRGAKNGACTISCRSCNKCAMRTNSASAKAIWLQAEL